MYITNDTIAYKTSLGMRVIQNRNHDELALPLRTLLILIDDKAKVSRYKSLLNSYSGTARFGGVKEMLKALYKLGLVDFRNGQEKTAGKMAGLRSSPLVNRLFGEQGPAGTIKPKYSSKVSVQVR